MDELKKKKHGQQEDAASLVSIVLSWSLNDVLNKNLFEDQVKKVPESFTSLEHYLGSFRTLLIEEARSDLASTLESISHSPYIEINYVEEVIGKYYKIGVRTPDNGSAPTGQGIYVPKSADVFVISESRPRHISDLTRPGRSYVIASFEADKDGMDISSNNFTIRTSRRLPLQNTFSLRRQAVSLYAVFLLNMTTYNRIWKALDVDFAKQTNLGIINMVLTGDSRPVSIVCSSPYDGLQEFDLNDSQQNAVLDCLSLRQKKSATVKLIWGPPGTGKTKTISTLLWSLLKLKCRTLTCTPTNTAVIEVASRVIKLLKERSSGPDRVSLGDVVIFGRKDRIKDGDEILGIHLDDRTERLRECFMPLTGWMHRFASMTDFLKNAIALYNMHLEGGELVPMLSFKKLVKNAIALYNKYFGESELVPKLSFKEFVTSEYFSLVKKLNVCLETFCQDLPTSSVGKDIFENMNRLQDLLAVFGTLLKSKEVTGEELELIFKAKIDINQREDRGPPEEKKGKNLRICALAGAPARVIPPSC